MRKAINFFETLNIRNKWIIIFFLLFIPRVIYIIFNSVKTDDSFFYFDVAENIGKGCGFSFTNNSGECQFLTGGYFPAFPYLIWFLKYIGLGDKFIPIIVSILAIISVFYLLFTLHKNGLKQEKTYALALILGISPIAFGYSRYILIEPILYVFSVLLLAEFINLRKNIKKFKFIYFRIVLLTIIAVFFKPTSIALIIPHFLIILNTYGIKRFLKSIIIFSLALVFFIMPWGLRDIQYGGHAPFKINASNGPENIRGLRSWLSTFSLTEYDHASTLYPIYDRENGDRKKIVINTKWNPFISENDSDYKKVIKILYKDQPSIKRGFNKDEEKIFKELAKKRLEQNGIIGNTSLFIIKSLSVLMNPLNSWGWPLEIGLEAKFSIFNSSLLIKLIFKFIIFVYRLILFSFYFKYFFNFIRSFNPLKIISKNNINLIKNNYILIGSFLLLMANIIMHIGIFHLVEHRYFYPVMPWIEFLVYSKLINNNALKLVN